MLLGLQETTAPACVRPHDVDRGDSRQGRLHSRGGHLRGTSTQSAL